MLARIPIAVSAPFMAVPPSKLHPILSPRAEGRSWSSALDSAPRFVTPGPHVTEEEVPRIARELKLAVVRHIPYAGNCYQLRGRPGRSFEILEICAALVKTGAVEWAEPDLVSTAVEDFVPDDFLYGQQGHHQVIGSETAWDTTMGDSDIVVAGFDSGFDLTHPDFTSNVAPGVDAYHWSRWRRVR